MKKNIIAAVVGSCLCASLVFSAQAFAADEAAPADTAPAAVQQPTDAEIASTVAQNKADEAKYAAELEKKAEDTKRLMLAKLSSKDAGVLLDNEFPMDSYQCRQYVQDVDVYENDLALDSKDMLKFMWIYGYTLGERGVDYAAVNDPEYVMSHLYKLCSEQPEAYLKDVIKQVVDNEKKGQ